MTSRVWSDLAYAARILAHHRGATAVAVLSIAVAIGPNAALFSIMDRVFLPGGLARAPQNLLGVRTRSAAGFDDVSYDEYRDLNEQNRVFSDLVASYRISGVVVTEDARELVATALVSSDYFGILRIRARAGRLFEAPDDRRTDSIPVIISDDLWHRRFSARPNVIGTSVVLNDRMTTIIGIVEPGFRGLNVFSPTDVWVPLEAWLAVDAETRGLLRRRDARAMQVMGLLRDGVTKRQAQTDLDAITAEFARAYPDATAGQSLVAWVARDDDRRKRVGFTAVALGLAGLVLLVACTNVSTMLLARAESRRRDTAIRLALGASRWRLFRLLIAEALLLALGASALGLLLAHWLLGLTPALKPVTPLPIVFDFTVNRSVVLYTMFLALVTT